MLSAEVGNTTYKQEKMVTKNPFAGSFMAKLQPMALLSRPGKRYHARFILSIHLLPAPHRPSI